MSTPRATARLQLHSGFTLADAGEQVPYYAGLGISHYYLSPITRARPGSTHGYDVIDHDIVNPELGGEAALVSLAKRLREHGMGLVIDIVPNHMAVDAGNAWWWDVLLKGRDSNYAQWFDIDWDTPDRAMAGKVLAPFLHDDYEHCLASGAIRLEFDATAGVFHIDACGTRYPVAQGSVDVSGEPQRCIAGHDPDTERGRQRLHALLARQHYQLACWRTAGDRINWRRFFAINELIGVCVERSEVFDAVHALTRRLYAEGLIDGVRVDHIDGLADPSGYCRRLRSCLEACSGQRPGVLRGQSPWIVVEKILASGETLPEGWQVAGSTGYDFMDQAGAVLHDAAGKACLTRHWEQVSQDTRDVSDYVHEARSLMLDRYFPAQRDSLLRAVYGLTQAGRMTRQWQEQDIFRVLNQTLIDFPVYRSYVGPDAVPGPLWRDALRRFQQLTPPLAAKSLEDTVFYRYGRLLSRNEVGSDPGVFSLPVSDFHQLSIQRARHTPQGMLTTATHDHKRGEDARARLAVISETPEVWRRASQRWLSWPGGGLDETCPGQIADRYMLLQCLVGAWPLDLSPEDVSGVGDFLQRMAGWQVKAMREAQLRTNWFDPDAKYEQCAQAFLDSLRPGLENHALLHELVQLVQTIAAAGAVNSLAQVVLRNTVPGVPDLYQGTEFWDFSLVDPDNRRSVDFPARVAALAALDDHIPIESLVSDWRTGRIKQAVLARLLNLRRTMPDVFCEGAYVPASICGNQEDRALAFLRLGQGSAVLIVVPLRCFAGVDRQCPQIEPSFWGDTCIRLPREYAGKIWRNALSGECLTCTDDGMLRLADVLARLPVAVLSMSQG